mmetsp:Transcript_22852/g.73550  ORF Transcript_22852/g.73550 Transcript_22852/m.73550 type:complete len:229 (+) Transcript_22852:624-1310(+)
MRLVQVALHPLAFLVALTQEMRPIGIPSICGRAPEVDSLFEVRIHTRSLRIAGAEAGHGGGNPLGGGEFHQFESLRHVLLHAGAIDQAQAKLVHCHRVLLLRCSTPPPHGFLPTLVHSPTLRLNRPKVEQRVRVALVCSRAPPTQRLIHAALHPQPLQLHRSDMEHGVHVTSVCRRAPPPHRLLPTLLHAFASAVTLAQGVHGLRITKLGRLATPIDSLRHVCLHAAA